MQDSGLETTSVKRRSLANDEGGGCDSGGDGGGSFLKEG